MKTAASTFASAELYDPASGTWTATGSLATARYNHTATLLPNGKVLVAGGQEQLPVSRARNSTIRRAAPGRPPAASPPHAMHHTATLLPNGKVLVAGGYGCREASLASAELYDPASGTWTATGSLATARSYHTATLLPNGKVLVAGGWITAPQRSRRARNSTIRRRAPGRSPAASSPHAHDHTATLLPNGKVLVAGGDCTATTLASAELYDPASGTWTATGSLATARSFHTATLLPNGKVLVAGGVWQRLPPRERGTLRFGERKLDHYRQPLNARQGWPHGHVAAEPQGARRR